MSVNTEVTWISFFLSQTMQLQFKPWKKRFSGEVMTSRYHNVAMNPHREMRWICRGLCVLSECFSLINCTNWSVLWWLTCDVAMLKHSKASLWTSSQIFVHLLLWSFYNILKKVIQVILITDFTTPNYFQILPTSNYVKLHTIYSFWM